MTTPVVEGKASFALRGHNPDVLSCIANLSNDEVFTPPELANRMLDTVAEAWSEAHDGASIWEDPSVTFLDPFTKSGVFLREITRRLTDGLAEQIPDLEERVDHILTRQVFGIGITQLTALLARRSVYCSKDARGEHSIAKSFDRDWGNIWFERTEHTWAGGKCAYCGASKAEYSRSEDLETHAYAFIHSKNIKARLVRMFGAEVQFDVIIGNPPYQMGAAAGMGEAGEERTGRLRDIPIYHRFVEQAKRLDPRYLVVVTPSRWMAGGLGLSEFRAKMLADRHIKSLIDYPVASEVFPGVEIKGGVSHFLWDANYEGDALVSVVRGENRVSTLRKLDEFDVFVRDAISVQILKKVLARKETPITTVLSADKEFGWTSNFQGFHSRASEGDVPIYYNRTGKRLVGYIDRAEVVKSRQLIDSWKVMIPSAGSGANVVPDVVLGKPFVASPPSVCTQTYLFFSTDSRESAKSIQSYLATKFVRFMVSLRKITQHASPATYSWVPTQNWGRKWTDDELYGRYELTVKEISYIESMIRPMELDDAES
jgi:site-specific DNA-methyltransferase (adenine-specific)